MAKGEMVGPGAQGPGGWLAGEVVCVCVCVRG